MPNYRLIVLIIVLFSFPCGAEEAEKSTACAAVISILEATEQIEPAAKEILIKTIRDDPPDKRNKQWSVSHGERIYAVAVTPVFKSKEARNQFEKHAENISRLRATSELFQCKAIMDRYIKTGLDDPDVLKKAFGKASNSKTFSGSADGIRTLSTIVDDWAIGLAFVDEKSFIETRIQGAAIDNIRHAYCGILHSEMKKNIEQKKWKEAFTIWEKCRDRKLFSPELFLDAAKIEITRNKVPEAVAILNDAFETYKESFDDRFFESIGQILQPINDPEARALALKSYKHSIELLLNDNKPAK